MFNNIRKDLKMFPGNPLKHLLFTIEFQTILSYRIQYYLYKKPRPIRWLVMPIRLITHYLTGCQIHYQAQIEGGVRLVHAIGVIIGTNVKIGSGTHIFQNVTLGLRKLGAADDPQIGKNVVIYAGAVVAGKVSVGDNCVIGANSVVTKDIPANHMAVGSPMKLIKIVDKKQ